MNKPLKSKAEMAVEQLIENQHGVGWIGIDGVRIDGLDAPGAVAAETPRGGLVPLFPMPLFPTPFTFSAYREGWKWA